MYKGLAQAQVQNGSSVLFWHDTWNGLLLSQQFPELLSFVKNQNISVQSMMQSDQPLSNYHLPLSIEAYNQHNYLQLILQNVHITDDSD